MTRWVETKELFHSAPRARDRDLGTTMSEDMAFTMVEQRTARLLGEATSERLLRLDGDLCDVRTTPAMRVRLGRALMGLGGHIAGARPEPPAVRPTTPPGSTRPAC